MPIPLDSSLFDSIAGLPLHPLVVHFAVVLLPLGALGLVVLVLVPKRADRYGWLTVGAIAVGTGAAFVAKESGEALAAKVGEPQTHASWGDRLPWLAVALLVLALAWFFLRRPSNGGPAGRSPAAPVVGLLAAIMAVIVTAVTVLVGHSGAQAAWGDVTAQTDQPSSDAAPSTSATPQPSTTTTSSKATPSSKSNSYTLADVAKHGTASSCWTAIDGNVYDVTDWITRHPGGQRPILGLCGKDGSSAFDNQHGGQSRPAAELKQFLIGTLA